MPIRGFPAHNVVAVYDEPNQSGEIDDFFAGRNAPARQPGAHLPLVHWHVDFFQYELAMPVQTVTVNHPALAGREFVWGPADVFWFRSPVYTSGISYTVPGQTSSAQRTLVTHNLGYEPLAFIAHNGSMIMPGVAVQTASDGRNRFVAPYVTSSVVGLSEVFNSSSEALPAATRTYQVMVFRVPAADAHRALFGLEGANVGIGRGKVDTSRQYLRRVGSGDTPFAIDRGPTVDINRGRARIVTGGVTTTEAGYGGSFGGSSHVAVGV